jgi:hypothetical protein
MPKQSYGIQGNAVAEPESLKIDARLKSRCITVAEELTNEFRHSVPPFSLGPAFKHFEIARVTERPLDRDACLKQGFEGLYIEVNSLYSEAVRRVGAAHEIGHLIVSQCSPQGYSHWGHHNKRIEDLCDRLGVVLLAPNWAVRQFLRREHGRVTHSTQLGRSVLQEAAMVFGLPVEMISSHIARVMDIRRTPAN